MAERQQSLGRTPQGGQDRQPHLCPACNREFKGLFDYPKVYVAGFERVALPDDVKFPIHARELFVSPRTNLMNKKVPLTVFEAFKDPQVETIQRGRWEHKEEYVEYKGWKWTRHESVPGHPEHTTYNVSKDDARNVVLFHANRYLDRVEQLVGQEVPSGLLRPPKLPQQIAYWLDFQETEDPNKTEESMRRASLQIQQIGAMLGIAGYTTDTKGVIGLLDYEGRLNI